MTCFSCRPECSLCSSLPDNCSQCSPGYFLEGNSCLTLCSDGLVGVLGYCLSCNDPCATCQLNQDNCSSCLSLFYIANSCVESSLCPNRTFPNATSLACEPCLPPCLTCYLLADNCTSCIDGFFLDSSSACVLPSQCPAGTVPGTGDSGVQECLPCDSICLGCA
jgi:proprotein convertase subtilisin/kexin type 5